MSENTFDTEEISLNLQPLPAYIDSDGSFKLNTPMLSSFNFDGSIPKFEGEINAGDIKPGYLLQVESGGEYYPVVSIEVEEADMEDSPSGIVTINYVDEQGDTVSIDYEETDQVSVVYEDWDDKIIGSQGWGITSGGNAIFTNVGVRGEIEATTMDIGGPTGITYDGTNVIIGASVTINAPVTFNGSGSFVTFNDLSASYALTSFVNTLNNRMSASLSLVSASLTATSGSVSRLIITDNILSASITNLYNAGFVTDSDLVTNGATTITGNNITTGTINANLVNVSSGLTGNRGVKINSLGLFAYDSGSNTTFSIDSNTGNVFLKGSITAQSGYFGNSSYGMSIVDDGSTVTLRTTTMRIGSQISGGTLHGKINFYNTSGTTLGSISSAASDKTTVGLGDGVTLGTTSDYIFIPSSGNSNRSRYLGSGFEWYNTSGQRLMSISGGTGGLRVENNTGGILVSGGGNIEVTGTGRFIGDGSGLTNLPGGAGGGVTSFKFGDTGPTETGAVAITGAEIITAINSNSIGNGKLINSTIQIMSTTKSLGGAFVAGDIDGDVITANTLPPGKISNIANLFSIGGTGVARGNSISTISGPLTIGNLSVTTGALDYVFNLGTTSINFNRAANPATINGLKTASTTIADSLNIGFGTNGQVLGTTGTAFQWVNGMTNPMTTFGDLIYGGTNATPSTPTRLAAGGTGSILKISTSLGLNSPVWLSRGTAGQFLRVNSGGTDIEWGSGMANPMTGVGQIIYGGTSGTPTALAAGTSGQILQSNGAAAPSWVNAPSGSLPSQSGNAGRYLTTDGTSTSWNFPITSISVPTSAFSGTVSNGAYTIGYTTSGGGDRNVLRSTSTGAVAMGKINGAHCNFPGTTVNPFVRYNSSTGDFHLTNANTAVSSIRFKKIVEDAIITNSNWLDEINLVKFKYLNDIERDGEEDAEIHVGLIAEDIVENPVLSQLVAIDEDNLPSGIEYDKIALLLVPIIKELRNKVIDLEAKLEAAGL